MSDQSRKSPPPKPIAIVIAAQMRLSMPKPSQTHRPAPVNVKQALKNAANSSPAAKAAFKRAAPAVKAATPHLNALAQPGKGLMSQLRHGVSAMHSLRKVTREMAKQPPSPLSSATSAFKAAATSSPAAAAAFQRAGPATATAQKHVDALSRMQSSPKPSLLSSLGHGVQAMRALRQVTREMKAASHFPPIVSASDESHGPQMPGKISGKIPGKTLEKMPGNAQSAPDKTMDHQQLIAHIRQQVQAAHAGHAQGQGAMLSGSAAHTSGPFAWMLIARRDSTALSAFKQRT